MAFGFKRNAEQKDKAFVELMQLIYKSNLVGGIIT